MLPPLPVQVDRLVSLGWPAFAGLSELAFRSRLEPVAGLDVDGLLVPPRRLVDPHAAIAAVALRGRTGFTSMAVEERIAWVAQVPEVLSDENCFSLAGSRSGDRRVSALWLSAKRPRLGWCWQGALHTWLGTASCAGRVAVQRPGRDQLSSSVPRTDRA